MNLQALETFLDNRNRAEPVAILTHTDPDMKTGRKVAGVYPNRFVDGEKNSLVTKIGWRNVFIGADYESVVNRQQIREGGEGDFEAQALWNGHGERVNRYLARNTNENSKSFNRLYLAVKTPNQREFPLEPAISHVNYVWKETGENLTADEIAELKEWFPEKDVETTQANQGVERPVFWNTIELCNIKWLRSAGQDFAIDIDRHDYQNAA